MYTMTEEDEQRTLFEWVKLQEGTHPELKLLFHVPNEGKRSYVTGGRMKAAGLKKGVPDLWLPVPKGRYHGLVIELKREKGGRVSDEQMEWIKALTINGYRAVIAFGWDAARKEIADYLREGV